MSSRTLLDQLVQVAGTYSGDFSDSVSNAHTSAVATNNGATGTLANDLNILRTMLKDLKGTTNWYDTTATTIQGLGTKYFIQRVHLSAFDNYSVSGTSVTTGSSIIDAIVAFDTANSYTGGAGTATTQGVIPWETRNTKILIRSHATGNAIDDGSGNEVYARLTYSGGNYTLAFYSDVAATPTAYTFGYVA